MPNHTLIQTSEPIRPTLFLKHANVHKTLFIQMHQPNDEVIENKLVGQLHVLNFGKIIGNRMTLTCKQKYLIEMNIVWDKSVGFSPEIHRWYTCHLPCLHEFASVTKVESIQPHQVRPTANTYRRWLRLIEYFAPISLYNIKDQVRKMKKGNKTFFTKIRVDPSQDAQEWMSQAPSWLFRLDASRSAAKSSVCLKQTLVKKFYALPSHGGITTKVRGVEVWIPHTLYPVDRYFTVSPKKTGKNWFKTNHGRRRKPRAMCTLASVAEGCNGNPGSLVPAERHMNWTPVSSELRHLRVALMHCGLDVLVKSSRHGLLSQASSSVWASEQSPDHRGVIDLWFGEYMICTRMYVLYIYTYAHMYVNVYNVYTDVCYVSSQVGSQAVVRRRRRLKHQPEIQLTFTREKDHGKN